LTSPKEADGDVVCCRERAGVEEVSGGFVKVDENCSPRVEGRVKSDGRRFGDGGLDIGGEGYPAIDPWVVSHKCADLRLSVACRKESVSCVVGCWW
jgi:hypothetical protein